MGQHRAGGRGQLYRVAGHGICYSAWNVDFLRWGTILASRSRRSEPCGVSGLCASKLLCSPFANADVHSKQLTARQPLLGQKPNTIVSLDPFQKLPVELARSE